MKTETKITFKDKARKNTYVSSLYPNSPPGQTAATFQEETGKNLSPSRSPAPCWELTDALRAPRRHAGKYMETCISTSLTTSPEANQQVDIV